MADTTSQSIEGPASELKISRLALKGLAGIAGMGAGALSPLARLESPREPARREELVAVLERLSGPWEWLVPALLDPRATAYLLLADGETILLGQYVWPDADARGPGFKVYVDGADLRVAGPLSLHEVKQGAFDFLSLAGVGELAALRLSLTSDQFWATNAIADAYHDAALRRRLARTPGLPVGISVAQVVAAWEAGLAAPNPGWSVSLFAMMLPASLPGDFGRQIPGLMAAMARDGLLTRLEGDGVGPAESLYFLDEGLDDLCQALYRASSNFGLVVQRKRPPNVEVAAVGGWRTSAGLALADLGRIQEDRVEMVLAGPSVLAESFETILGPSEGAPSFDGFAVETPFTRAAVLDGLRSGTPVASNAAASARMERADTASAAASTEPSASPKAARTATCPNCGRVNPASVRFCGECGARIETAPSACANCGAALAPGARFCVGCGAPVSGS